MTLVAAGVLAAIAASVPRKGYGEATDALPAVYDVDTVAVFYETRPVEVAQRMAVVLLAAGRFGLSLLLDQARCCRGAAVRGLFWRLTLPSIRNFWVAACSTVFCMQPA